MRDASAPIRVRLLGPIQIDECDAGRGTARALIAALTAGGSHPGDARTVAELADEVWGDDQPQNPRGALQTLISRVRASAGVEFVVSTPVGYASGAVGDDVDLQRARRLAAAADALPPTDPAVLQLADAALALWRGNPGADLGHAPIAAILAEAAATVRERLHEVRARALVAQDRAGEAVPLLDAHANAHPFDESAHRTLMEALAAAGRAQEALAVFARFRARLRDELGASPTAETVALNARLLRDDPGEPAARIRIGLRAAPNPLVGRDEDLQEVVGHVARARLVTVLGAGGLGKTRLVQAVAEASEFPVVAVVELASVRADDDVLPAIASALGISDVASGGRLADVRARPDVRTRLLGRLAERPTLVVLDNCEQVIDGVAAWTAEALAGVPGLRVLTTSRTPLSIAGETVFPLAPLAAGDAESHGPAVQLFLDRARAVRPGATLPLEVVTRLCTHLDGLPLAIELAAARVRTMTPAQIEARLKDRFALLTTGDRTAPERHRTLEAVIAWSWDLLDSDAQRALETLSILPAGFSAQTAADVLVEDRVDDVLDRLVAQSLLVVSENPRTGVRFRMLETVREFAIARLDETGHRDAAWEAVVGWARAFALDRVARVFEVEVFDDIRAEHDNLLSVLRHVMPHGADADTIVLFSILSQAWMVRGSISEMEAFAEEVIDALGRVTDRDVPAVALVPVLVLAGFIMLFTEDPRATRLIARARILGRRHGDLPPMMRALNAIIGAATGEEGVLTEIDRLRVAPDPFLNLVGELALSQIAENRGDVETGRATAARAWELAVELDQMWVGAMAAMSYAELASQSGEFEVALQWIARSAEGFAAFGAEDQLRQQGWVRGGSLLSIGRLDEARTIFQELAELRELSPDGLEMASVGWFGLAEVARAQGDTAAAAEYYLRAMERFHSTYQRRSPWYLMAMSGLVSATTFDRSLPAAEIARWAHRLRGRALATYRMRPEFVDRPVLGTVLNGWSAWALSVPALRTRALDAVALAEVLGGRQDLPSLHFDAHLDHAAAIAGAEALAAARDAASALSFHDRVVRAIALLAEPLP